MLHIASINNVRNGMQMCAYTLYHSEEMTNPVAGFFLGFCIIMVNFFAESVNLVTQMNNSDIPTLLNKYIAFKVLLEGPDFYGKQRENFKIKKALSAPLVINKVDNPRYD